MLLAGLATAWAPFAAGQSTAAPGSGDAGADTTAPESWKGKYVPPPGGYPSPPWAAVRSMILPGWGQLTNGAAVKAVAFAGAYAGFAAWGISVNQDVQDARGALNAARGTSEESFYENEVDRLAGSRDAKFWFAGLTLVLSMADAFVDASLRDFDKRIEADVALVPGAGLNLGVTLGWDTGGRR